MVSIFEVFGSSVFCRCKYCCCQSRPGYAKITGNIVHPLPRRFYDRETGLVARELLGKFLVHGDRIGRIVETEAYLGPHDLAAHSARGRTKRNAPMFGPPGHAYVYSIYGRYYCMNVTCQPPGLAGCILLRALEPLGSADALAHMAMNRGLDPAATIPEPLPQPLARQLTSGPSRLCQALGLTRAAHNALDLLDPRSPLQLRDDGFPITEPLITPRIGIHEAVDWPLRFAVRGHPCVSGPARLR